MTDEYSVWIGFDPREVSAFAVARRSLWRRAPPSVAVRGLVLSDLRARGLYRRPIERRPGPTGKAVLWDTISGAPMATEHACARFLVYQLGGRGWALFMDGDILVRGDLSKLFDELDPRMALHCVKHPQTAFANEVKMDGQWQLPYARKLWSSVFAINCDHEANRALTLEMVNALPGRDLHRFCWLDDALIGELHPRWNYLVGVSSPVTDPAICHFTLGLPDMPGFEHCEYADLWRAELADWALS